MAKRNNSARRLHRILSEAKRNSGNVTVINIWTATCNFEKNNVDKVVKYLLKLLDLTNTVEQEIKALDIEDHEHYLRPLPTIQKVLERSLVNLTATKSLDGLTDIIMEQLSYAPLILSNNGVSEESISEEDLAKLKEDINALKEKIIDSELEGKIKNLFTKTLNELLNAIEFYQIDGINGFDEALLNGAYSILVAEKSIKDKKDTNVESRYLRILDIVNKTIETVKKARPLLGPVTALLGSGEA